MNNFMKFIFAAFLLLPFSGYSGEFTGSFEISKINYEIRTVSNVDGIYLYIEAPATILKGDQTSLGRNFIEFTATTSVRTEVAKSLLAMALASKTTGMKVKALYSSSSYSDLIGLMIVP